MESRKEADELESGRAGKRRGSVPKLRVEPKVETAERQKRAWKQKLQEKQGR